MDNARAFHQRVFSLRPKQSTKPTTFWVAILKAAAKISSNVTEEDFLWIKCHGEIKASVIRAQYEQKNPSDGKIKLKLATLVTDNETMRSLDHFKDQLVVFEVVKTSESPSSQLTRGRSPLRPTINQIKSPPLDPGINPGQKDHKVSRTLFSGRIPSVNGQDENYNPHPGLQPQPLSSQPTPAAVSSTSMIPKPEPVSPSHVVNVRPDWATSKGFSFYEAQTREKTKTKWSHLNSGKFDQTLPMRSLLTWFVLQHKYKT